ncbi:MAG TPA: redox-sensing transcriptional repressor Rex [Bacteroidales bacterium]|nr:redox-sensing transcriptional repressor Rex [Bacteroidales bacterium]HOL97668.1 redox-sensing transcriptional repressor Rex [Bacteroidales bacterium]HOM37258.1 redox-sensing transcriptional repressor Rex [Bacteroidales bacterium]HPD24819.1 redox-sensing transcriptional repressor Rex [Bacteroidales bacterium]HRT00336.1 redox-sensing transcriptional repressor Rex [Bacteroidales bacterium]
MIPEKTIERLSKYRRYLLEKLEKQEEYLYSHELAAALHLTPEQVRRDIMLIGYTGTQRKGYSIKELIDVISKILDEDKKINAVIIGMGHLGKAISNYFSIKRSNIEIVAAFDIDSNKVDRIISGIKSYHVDNLDLIINETDAKIAILTLSPAGAQDITDQLVYAGIKGILNFTSITLRVPEDVYIENYDMITSLEKVAYFVKESIDNEGTL